MLKIADNFFVISDTHFYHDNIVKYCGRAEQIAALTGGKANKYNHNSYMVDRWNSVVGPEDTILHLGDLYAWFKDGRTKFEYNVLPRLNGEIYMIRGNHDKDTDQVYESMGITILKPFTDRWNGKLVSFDHYPWQPREFRENEIRVHGHIHNNGYPKTSNWQDGTEPTQPNQVNMSVEVVDYTPQRIQDALRWYA
jgi:calcineurin-like phosphoesterase family protein